jgi:hypothetical protein
MNPDYNFQEIQIYAVETTDIEALNKYALMFNF